MRKKLLIFGSNFSLAQRIAGLGKREFEVINYEFSANSESGQIEVSTTFTGELLSTAVAIHKAQYVVFTSESLLYIHSPSILSGLLGEFRAFKRLPSTFLAYVDIAEPIVAEAEGYIQVLQGNSAYGDRIVQLRQSLAGVADSVLQVQSVYSSEDEIWGPNFLRLLFNSKRGGPIEVLESVGDWEALAGDEVAQALVNGLGYAGTTRLTYGPYPGGLKAFCAAAIFEFGRWLVSQTTPLPNHGNQDLFTPYHKKIPIHFGLHPVVRQTHCAVNYLYRKAPEDTFGVRTVARFRYELGNTLAKSIPRDVAEELDMIVPVPETGKMYAKGLANGLDLPYVEAIHKADHERSFDIESSHVRREFLYSRLSVVPGLLASKNVMVVDEAIFTGATLKVVSHLLRNEGVRCVYFAIPSPEARYACKFNMQPKRDLLSEYVRKEDLWSYFNVQAVFFQDEEAFVQCIEHDGPLCLACFIQRGSND